MAKKKDEKGSNWLGMDLEIDFEIAYWDLMDKIALHLSPTNLKLIGLTNKQIEAINNFEPIYEYTRLIRINKNKNHEIYISAYSIYKVKIRFNTKTTMKAELFSKLDEAGIVHKDFYETEYRNFKRFLKQIRNELNKGI